MPSITGTQKKLEFGFGSKKTQDPDIRAKIFGLKYALISIQISKETFLKI